MMKANKKKLYYFMSKDEFMSKCFKNFGYYNVGMYEKYRKDNSYRNEGCILGNVYNLVVEEYSDEDTHVINTMFRVIEKINPENLKGIMSILKDISTIFLQFYNPEMPLYQACIGKKRNNYNKEV